ncbi:hypothetical protein GDO86_007040 [Hymenochirus boettgeri]|uniref:Vang-like protein n=1 Tax=Hymenochirus boettgeri TaxID=247094 RepID=A0A8T2JDY6_9PIPI|nr:hypothetical protein GDO86_007040 [Hymenochirus boettgeri]
MAGFYVTCEGLYISVAFKLLLLVLATGACSSAPPGLLFLGCEFHALLLFFSFAPHSYWLFYGVRVLGTQEKNLLGVVEYSASLVDTLLFIHYLALVLLESASYNPLHHQSDAGEVTERLGSTALGHERSKHENHCDRKVYSLDGPDVSAISQSQSLISTSTNYKDRYNDEKEHARKVHRRKTRLVWAVHDAFSQLKHLVEREEEWKSPSTLQPREAAQSVFPLMAQSLQRYLRSTQQCHLHSMEGIIQHLATCVSHRMSPEAFLEQYLHPGPPAQYLGDPNALWTLVSEESVTIPLRSDLTFCLQGSDTQLVVSVSGIPFLKLSETFLPSNSHRFIQPDPEPRL